MQGFFVHVSNGVYPVTGALGMTNSVRINNLNPYFHKYARVDDRPLIRLSARFDQEGATADPTVIYFDDLGSADFNQERDALKMLNTDALVPNLYSVTADNEWLSIKGLAFPADSLTVIPLGLTTLQEGWVAFRASDIKNLPDGMHVYLLDTETGMNQDMQNSLQYRVYLPAGEYTGRFQLKLSLIDLVDKPVTSNGFLAFCSGDDLRIKLMLPPGENAVLSVCNLMGQVVWRQDLSGMGYSEISRHLTTGIYIVSLYRSTGIQSQKVYIPYK
jgi:fibronectin-binding autotransporter adhesin